MLRGTTRDTTSTTRYYEAVRVTTSDTTRYYEELRVVPEGSKKYYELFYESHWGITRGFRCNEWFFTGILPKIILQKKLLWTISQNSWKTNCDRVLALVKLQPYAETFTEKGLHRGCFPMTLNNCELWCIANCHEQNWTLDLVKHLR